MTHAARAPASQQPPCPPSHPEVLRLGSDRLARPRDHPSQGGHCSTQRESFPRPRSSPRGWLARSGLKDLRLRYRYLYQLSPSPQQASNQVLWTQMEPQNPILRVMETQRCDLFQAALKGRTQGGTLPGPRELRVRLPPSCPPRLTHGPQCGASVLPRHRAGLRLPNPPPRGAGAGRAGTHCAALQLQAASCLLWPRGRASSPGQGCAVSHGCTAAPSSPPPPRLLQVSQRRLRPNASRVAFVCP